MPMLTAHRSQILLLVTLLTTQESVMSEGCGLIRMTAILDLNQGSSVGFEVVDVGGVQVSRR